MSSVDAAPPEQASLIPQVPLHWGDLLTLNAYFIGLGYMWNCLKGLAFLAILPMMVGQLNQGTAIAILETAGLLFAIIVQPAAGALSDRLTARMGRRRPYMIAGTVGDLIFMAGVAWSFSQPLTAAGVKLSGLPLTDNADYWFLFLMYCGLQFTSNVAHGAAQGLIPDVVPEAQRGTASGWKSLIDVLMVVVAAATAPRIVAATGAIVPGVQNLVLVAAAILVVSLVINVLSVHEQRLPPDRAPTASVRKALQRTFYISPQRDPDYIWLLASRLFVLAGAGIVRTFSFFFIQDVILAGQTDAALLTTIFQGNLITAVGGAVLLVSIPAGMVSDRLGRKPLVVVCAIIAGIGAALILFTRNAVLFSIGPVPVSDLIVAALVFGMGYGVFNTANWAWATDLIHSNEAGRYLGLSNLATAGSQILSILAGILLDLFNRQSPGSGFNVIFILSAVWLIFGALLALRVRETRGRQPAAAVG